MTPKRYVLALIVGFALAGCEIAPKQPDVHDFGLPIVRGHSSGTAIVPNIDLDAPKWLWDTRIRYRLLYKSPTKVNFYMLDRWIATPPELFKQQLVEQTNLRFPLAITFLDFEQQFDNPKQAKVFMRLSVTAYAAENKPLATREFQWRRLTPSADAKGAVEGFAYLVRTAVNDIDGWLAGLPSP